MRELERLLKGNPVAVLIGAGLAGWAIGSGLVPLGGLTSGIHLPTHAAAPSSVAASPAPAAAPAAGIATSSASMPPGVVTPADPFAGYGL